MYMSIDDDRLICEVDEFISPTEAVPSRLMNSGSEGRMELPG